MKRKEFSEVQIIGILKGAEAGAVVTDPCPRAPHLRNTRRRRRSCNA